MNKIFFKKTKKFENLLKDYSNFPFKRLHEMTEDFCAENSLFEINTFGDAENTVLRQNVEEARKAGLTREYKDAILDKVSKGLDIDKKQEAIIDKFRATNLEKYGCENPSQNKDVSLVVLQILPLGKNPLKTHEYYFFLSIHPRTCAYIFHSRHYDI